MISILQTAGFLVALLLVYALLLVSCEHRLVYHPYKYPEGFWEPASVGVTVEDVSFQAEDGTRLHGWFVPSRDAVATLLWFHGNAGNLTHRLDNIQRLRPLKLNIFIFDYRGYGKSEGQPGEPGIYLDSQAAYEVLVQDKKVRPDRLFLFGRSLGAVCAVDVAVRNPAAGLILESAFTSAEDMAGKIFPFFPLGWAIRSRLDAMERIPRVRIPKLFLHGTLDEVVPYSLGRKLYEAAGEPKRFYDIAGARHNDTYLLGGPAYFEAIQRFIRDTLDLTPKN